MTEKLSRWVVVLIVVALFAVPGTAQDALPDYESVDPTGTTVVFWYQHSGEREAALLEIIQAFNETNEYGIVVNGVYLGGYGDIFDRMLTVIGTPDAPGLVVAYQNQAATYQLYDGLVDMNALVDSPTWGLTAAEQADFFPSFFNADVFSTFGGARLGFPPNRSAEVMFVNTDWLAELAASGAISFEGLPQTPEQFREAACAAVTNPFSGVTGDPAASIGYELSVDASRFAAWTFAFGGDIFDYGANQYTYDSDAAVAAMTFLQGLFADGCAKNVSERDRDIVNFGAGTTLFTIGSTSDLPDHKGAVDAGAGHAWTISALPHTTDEPVVNIYGASVSIPRTTPEQELAAWVFLKYYTSPEAQASWAQASNYFPVRASVAEGLDGYFAANTAYAVGFDLLQYGTTEPPVAGYDFVRGLVEQQMAAIMDGAPVAETLAAVNAEANAILADQLAALD